MILRPMKLSPYHPENRELIKRECSETLTYKVYCIVWEQFVHGDRYFHGGVGPGRGRGIDRVSYRIHKEGVGPARNQHSSYISPRHQVRFQGGGGLDPPPPFDNTGPKAPPPPFLRVDLSWTPTSLSKILHPLLYMDLWRFWEAKHTSVRYSM